MADKTHIYIILENYLRALQLYQNLDPTFRTISVFFHVFSPNRMR